MIDLNSARLRIVWLAVFLCGYYSMPAQAATPLCGTTLTSNTKLDSDMNCPGRAILFNQQSNNVILNCDGFTISSDSDRIISANFASRITIKNCSFSSTDDGIRAIVLTGVTKSKVINNTITTTGDRSSAFDIRGDSRANLFNNNMVHTSGSNSNAFWVRAGSNKNTIKNNVFQADGSYAVNIQSAAYNELSGNTLISPNGFLYQGKYSLQNGGITVDAAGNIFAVENNWGSSAGDGAGIGEATAFFQVDPATGTPISVIPLLRGRKDVGFGFDALEILPNGRVLALRGCCTDSYLFEIDPISGRVTEIEIDLPPGASGNLNGLEAIDNSSLLATTNQGNLISIDLDAGEMDLIGDQNKGWTGIAIHPTTGEVYTVSRQRNETSRTAHLYKIDINDGQVITEIGDTGSPAISGIDFALDGTLYGSNDLENIDINTGVSTTVGNFGSDPLEPRSKRNFLKNNLLQTTNGSLRYPGKIVLPSVEHVDMSADRVSITDNQVLVESAELPFLDEKARIVLEGLPGTYRNLLIDPEDDGSFEPCGSPQCKFVSFMDGNLVFDVKGFTTYSSEENTAPSLQFVVNTILAELKVLRSQPGVSKSTKKKLNNAIKTMGKARKFLKKGNLKKGFTETSKTVRSLNKITARLPEASTLIDRLVEASKAEAQNAINSAAWSLGDPILIALAEGRLINAQDLLDLGKPDKAIKSYLKALQDAKKADTGRGDLISPVVTAPGDILIIAAGAGGTPVTDTIIQAFLAGATATDNADGDLTSSVTDDALETFPVGMTTVTFAVLDAAGNSDTDTAVVTVAPLDEEVPGTASIVINSNAQYALSLSQFSARLMSSDNVGVTAYLVTEHNATDPGNVMPPYLDPLPSGSGWVAVTEAANLDTTVQISLTQAHLLGDTVELCTWFMDAQANISARVCDSIVYGNDWSNGQGNWSADNGVWQVGTPTAGPPSCFTGSQCAGTVLGGIHPKATDSRLVSASLQLPDVSGSDEVHLRFQEWFSYGTGASGWVQVSVWDSTTSTWGDWVSEGDSVVHGSGGWSVKGVDLTAYEGELVRIGFLHQAQSFTSSFGWYIDDITIVQITPSFSGGFESGWDDWSAGRGVWQVGTPTAGPPSCFIGSQCAGTVLGGIHPKATDSRLVSASLQLPDVSGSDEVHLRFQQWFSYGTGASGWVQVSEWDSTTSTWRDWVSEGNAVINGSGGWSLRDVDLTAYEGELVRIGFLHQAQSFTSSFGWYIDEITITVF